MTTKITARQEVSAKKYITLHPHVGESHLCQSQCEFDIARDVVTLLKAMEHGETVSIEVTANGGTFDWRCSGDNQPCGPSEASRAMREGYESVFSPFCSLDFQ